MAEAPPNEAQEVLPHISALDGIRGLAILLVLLNHVFWSNDRTGNRILDLFARLREAGWVGVDLFFALSGFLITGILFESLHDAHFFKNFYARRVLRIFPLYYAVLLVLMLTFHSLIRDHKEPFLLLLGYLQNTSLWWHMRAPGAITDATGHLWSLAVEEQFYLVWPLLVWLVRDRKHLVWLCVALSLGALFSRVLLLHSGAPLTAPYKLTFCRADSLLGGAWLALVLRGAWRERVLRAAPYAFALSLAACCFIGWSNRSFDWERVVSIDEYGFSVLAIASTSLIAMALSTGGLVSRMAQARWLRFLGKYSYGIYIYHQVMIALLAATLAPILLHHIHSKILYRLSSAVLVIGVTIAVSVASFHLYERPFLQMKRFFNYDRGSAHSTSRATENADPTGGVTSDLQA
jgi:peptidoglycan/LPS O-acetylase OafA/YrhL